MPRHSFIRKGKLNSKFHPVRRSEQSGQTRRCQDILRRNDPQLAVIEGLFKRNYKGIKHVDMDHDFSLINWLRSQDFLETLLTQTDGKQKKETTPKDQDPQKANAGESGTENTDYDDGPSAKKAKQPDFDGDSCGFAVQVPATFLGSELAQEILQQC